MKTLLAHNETARGGADALVRVGSPRFPPARPKKIHHFDHVFNGVLMPLRGTNVDETAHGGADALVRVGSPRFPPARPNRIHHFHHVFNGVLMPLRGTNLDETDHGGADALVRVGSPRFPPARPKKIKQLHGVFKRAVDLLLLTLTISTLAAQERLTFTKSFPGSIPPLCSVQVAKDGAMEYKESPDDKPLEAKLTQAETDTLFEMAAKLNYFKGNLESGLKVANTGKKTFRYESPTGERSETVFNYSLDVTAQQLWDRFEQIAQSERSYLDLDRAIHFDKLGVNDALAAIESMWLNKQLAAPLQFVPLLTRVSTHESFMHLARERAARLKDEFTAAP